MTAIRKNTAARFRRSANTVAVHAQNSDVTRFVNQPERQLTPAEIARTKVLPVTYQTSLADLSTKPRKRIISAESQAKADHFAAISAKRRQEKQDLIDNQIAITEKHGLQYVHAGMTTIAYTVHRIADRRPGSVIRLSTAICHSLDSYSKGMGSAYAAQNFDQGHFIELKSPLGAGSAREFLKAMSGILVYPEVAEVAIDEADFTEYYGD